MQRMWPEHEVIETILMAKCSNKTKVVWIVSQSLEFGQGWSCKIITRLDEEKVTVEETQFDQSTNDNCKINAFITQ